MQCERLAALYSLASDGHMLRIMLSIASIFVDFCLVSSAPEKAQWNAQVTRCPVSQASDIPFMAVLACYRYELARHSIDHSHRIPCCRNILDELKLRLVGICRRCIGHHRQRFFKYNVEGQLLRSRARHHWTFIAGYKILRRHVVEPARRIVHWPAQHAREGKRGAVDGTIAAPSLVLFQAEHCFIVENVGIGFLDTPRLRGIVKVHHKMMLGSKPGHI